MWYQMAISETEGRMKIKYSKVARKDITEEILPEPWLPGTRNSANTE